MQEYETLIFVDGQNATQEILSHYALNIRDAGQIAEQNQIVEYVLCWHLTDEITNLNLSRLPNFPIMNLGEKIYLPKLPTNFLQKNTNTQVPIFDN